LVIDRAVGSDQGLKFVYVLDKDNKVQYQRVKTGALQDDGLRVIEEGITATDRVVVGSLPRIRPRTQVEPDPAVIPPIRRDYIRFHGPLGVQLADAQPRPGGAAAEAARGVARPGDPAPWAPPSSPACSASPSSASF